MRHVPCSHQSLTLTDFWAFISNLSYRTRTLARQALQRPPFRLTAAIWITMHNRKPRECKDKVCRKTTNTNCK